MESQDLGFRKPQTAPGRNSYPRQRDTAPQLSGLYENILERVEALPGVRSATLSSVPVINPGQWGSPISILGYAARQDETVDTRATMCAARYFETVGIPVLLGRPIGPQDTATFIQGRGGQSDLCQRLFSPVGMRSGAASRFADPGVPGTWQIVGVVRDAKYSSAREAPQRMIYLPLVQIAGPHAYAHSLQLLTVGDPASVAGKRSGELSHKSIPTSRFSKWRPSANR